MRILSRNKQELWYATHVGETYVVDSNGLKTGEKQQTYSTPVKVKPIKEPVVEKEPEEEKPVKEPEPVKKTAGRRKVNK